MKKFIYLLWFIPVLALGQKTSSVMPGELPWLAQNPQCNFPGATLTGNSADELIISAEAYLKSNIADLRNQNTGLSLTQNIASPYARYFTFSETFQNTEIYGTSIKIGLDKQNKIINVISKTGAVDNWPTNVSIPDPDTNMIK